MPGEVNNTATGIGGAQDAPPRIAPVLISAGMLLITFWATRNGLSALSRKNPPLLTTFGAIGVIAFANVVRYSLWRPFSLQLIHWIYVFAFFFIAPIAQYGTGELPWSMNTNLDERLPPTNLIILTWCVVWSIFAQPTKLTPQQMEDRPWEVAVHWRRFAGVRVLLLLAAAAFLAQQYGQRGLNGLFLRGAASDEASYTASSIDLLINYAGRALPLALLLLAVSRSRARGESLKTANVFGAGAVVLITNFPLATARFWSALVAIGVLATFGLLRRRWTLTVAVVLGLGILMPVLGAARHATDLNEFLVALTSSENNQAWLTPDFDAYSVLTWTHEYTSDFGSSNGSQLLTAMLFFVPRALWADKSVGSGYFVAHELNLPFDNISNTLPAEGIINFGYIGVVAFAAVSALICARLDTLYWTKRAGLSLSLIYPFLLGAFFFVLRGDMLSSMSYAVGLVVPLLAVFALADGRKVTENSTAPEPDPPPTGLKDGGMTAQDTLTARAPAPSFAARRDERASPSRRTPADRPPHPSLKPAAMERNAVLGSRPVWAPGAPASAGKREGKFVGGLTSQALAHEEEAGQRPTGADLFDRGQTSHASQTTAIAPLATKLPVDSASSTRQPEIERNGPPLAAGGPRVIPGQTPSAGSAIRRSTPNVIAATATNGADAAEVGYNPLSRIRRLAGSAAAPLSYAGFMGIAQILSTIFFALLARRQGPSATGEFIACYSVAALFATFVDFGEATNAVRILAATRGAFGRRYVRYAGARFFLVVLLTSFGLALGQLIPFVGYALALGTMMSAQTFFIAAVRIRSGPAKLALCFIVEKVVTIGVFLFVPEAQMSTYTPALYICCGLLVSVLLCLTYWPVKQIMRNARPSRAAWYGGGHMGVSTIINRIQLMDVVAVSAFASKATAGTYGAVNRWGAPFNLYSQSVAQYMLPQYAKEATHAAAEPLLRRTNLLLAPAAFALVVMSFASPWLVDLVLGRAFQDSAMALSVLCYAYIAAMYASSYYVFVQARHLDRFAVKIYVVSTLIQFTILYPAVHFYGAAGASAAFLIGQAVLAMGCRRLVTRHMSRPASAHERSEGRGA